MRRTSALVVALATTLMFGCSDALQSPTSPTSPGSGPGASTDASSGSAEATLGSGTSTTDGRDADVMVEQDPTAAEGDFVPAFLVPPNDAYAAAISGTQWIGPFEESGTTDVAPGTFTFRTDFELPESGFLAPRLEITVHADNRATFRLNGSEVAAQPPFGEAGNANFRGDPETFTVDDIGDFARGTNTLKVDLLNATENDNPAGLDFQVAVDYTPVAIDIKPGSDPNSINLRSQGVIPVALLGSEEFDVGDVDFGTLDFDADNDAEPAHDGQREDVNDDGFTDLVTHWHTPAGITADQEYACLTGQTSEGDAFRACDSVNLVGEGASPGDDEDENGDDGKGNGDEGDDNGNGNGPGGGGGAGK